MPNRKYVTYSEEKIREAVKNSFSVMETMRLLGISYLSGSMHNHITSQIKKFKIDSSHFLGQGRNCGKSHRGGPEKRTPKDIFIINKNGERTRTRLLKRAMLEDGFEYKCLICGISEWLNNKLTLEIEHKNGDALDNRRENLCFLCPNCHSQQPTTNNRKRVRVA